MENKQSHYDKIAEKRLKSQKAVSFPLHISAPYNFYQKKLESLQFPHGRQFLDLGCGMGYHSRLPVDLGFNVTGIDISKNSLKVAKSSVGAKYENQTVNFINLAADKLESIHQNFDVIFCSGVMYYLDWKLILPLVYKRLRPGGHFFCIETLGDNEILNLVRKIKQGRNKYRDEKSMKDLLRLEDFSKFSQSFDVSEYHYFDFLTLIGFGLEKFPFIAKPWHSSALRVDEFVLNKLKLQKLAFKIVFHGKKKESIENLDH